LEKHAAMKAFGQMLRYIRPQWPRIIVVVLSAMAIAAMLSLSFVTIIPLLKVMIGTEGLHGWVDRKASEYYYGLEFYAPAPLQLTDGPGPSLRTHLWVTKVAKGSLAERAGIRPWDYIADVNDLKLHDPNTAYLRLLQELTVTKQNVLHVELRRRAQDSNSIELLPAELKTPGDPRCIETLNWTSFQRARWQAGVAAVRGMQWLVSFLPREQTAENKVKAVFLIVLVIGVTTVVRCVAKYFQDYEGQKIVEVAANHLREDVFERLTRMPIKVFANEKPSDMISRIVRDTVIMSTALRVLLGKALREPMNAIAMMTLALYFDWKLTLVFLGGGPMVAVLFHTFGRKMKKATRRSLAASSQMLAKLQEAVAGLRVIKVYNQEQYEQRAFQDISNRLLRQLLNMAKVDAATQPVLEVLGMFAGCAALVVGMRWVAAEQLDGAEFLGLLQRYLDQDSAGERRRRADLRGARAAGRDREAGCPCPAAGETAHRIPGCNVLVSGCPAAGPRPDQPGRHVGPQCGHRRPQRLRQNDPGQLAAAVLRPGRRPRPDRRARCP
jgi:ABC-type multidrug transport system fused ATPase/permease subunit